MPNYRYRPANNMQRTAYATQRADHGCPACSDSCVIQDELSKMALAMSYVPWQDWCNLYESEKGFSKGTIFADLDKVFLGKGGCCK